MKRFLAALACCGLLALSSCSDDSSSSADPPNPTPSSMSSSAEPSPTQEAETPEEFVRRWVEADTHMQNTGEGADYREMSPECPNCLEYADYIEGIWDAGGYVKTDGWSISSAHTSRQTSQGQIDVTLSIDAAPTEYVEAKGERVQHHAGGRADYIVSIAKAAGTYSVLSFAQVAA